MPEAANMDGIFATLTPANTAAKVAFSEVFGNRPRQGSLTEAAFKHMMITGMGKEYDADALQFRRDMARKLSGRGERDTSENLTDPDTDTEGGYEHLGMIWKGHYVLGLCDPPMEEGLGWVAVAGICPIHRFLLPDIILCTVGLAEKYSLDAQCSEARFNFDRQDKTFFIAIRTKSSSGGITVNGESLGQQRHVLDQHSATICIGPLEYKFQYTDFASTEEFMSMRKHYIQTLINRNTPPGNTTLGNTTLGDMTLDDTTRGDTTPPQRPKKGDLSVFFREPPNVVETQGAYLITQAPTPYIFCRIDVEDHAKKLYDKLECLAEIMEYRLSRWGDGADEYPLGRTPPEIKEESTAEAERLVELLLEKNEAPSPPHSSPLHPGDAPDETTSRYQSRLLASVSAALEPMREKKRPREDTEEEEESRPEKIQKVAERIDCQSQLFSPDSTAAEPIIIL
ncbi:hypothetical protein F5Y14DRAFT_458775 [Nemania sp. NC0429]|nr:hypothetical protein F5Y14DRAFT_458775 [Nemania sp. NC0429]